MSDIDISFVCLPAVQESSSIGFYRQSYSFEVPMTHIPLTRHRLDVQEVRVMDYLRFFQTTGRPPPPCPDEPSDDLQRAALGLPPRFTPWKDPTAPLPTQQPMPHVPIPPPIGSMFDPTTNYSPERLAQIQVHAPLRVGTEVYENISCTHKFAWYSVEVCSQRLMVVLDPCADCY